MLDSAGRQIEQARRTPSGFLGGLQNGQPIPHIVLHPGQQATTRIENYVGTNGGNCPHAAAFLFTLPDNTDSTRFDKPLLACAGGLQIHPLLPGGTGNQP